MYQDRLYMLFDLSLITWCTDGTLLPAYLGSLSETLGQAVSLAALQVSCQVAGPMVPVSFLTVCKMTAVHAALVSCAWIC